MPFLPPCLGYGGSVGDCVINYCRFLASQNMPWKHLTQTAFPSISPFGLMSFNDEKNIFDEKNDIFFFNKKKILKLEEDAQKYAHLLGGKVHALSNCYSELHKYWHPSEEWAKWLCKIYITQNGFKFPFKLKVFALPLGKHYKRKKNFLSGRFSPNYMFVKGFHSCKICEINAFRLSSLMISFYNLFIYFL